ncbi:hypothetical protein D3C81_785000 [compost metagenome]
MLPARARGYEAAEMSQVHRRALSMLHALSLDDLGRSKDERQWVPRNDYRGTNPPNNAAVVGGRCEVR